MCGTTSRSKRMLSVTATPGLRCTMRTRNAAMLHTSLPHVEGFYSRTVDRRTLNACSRRGGRRCDVRCRRARTRAAGAPGLRALRAPAHRQPARRRSEAGRAGGHEPQEHDVIGDVDDAVAIGIEHGGVAGVV